jgi:hypothetical protein
MHPLFRSERLKFQEFEAEGSENILTLPVGDEAPPEWDTVRREPPRRCAFRLPGQNVMLRAEQKINSQFDFWS